MPRGKRHCNGDVAEYAMQAGSQHCSYGFWWLAFRGEGGEEQVQHDSVRLNPHPASVSRTLLAVPRTPAKLFLVPKCEYGGEYRDSLD